MKVSGRLSVGDAPLARRVMPLLSRVRRVSSVGEGAWKAQWTPRRSVVKSSESGMPCKALGMLTGLRRGLERSPPVGRNQPSRVHSTGSRRHWRPRVQKPFS